MTDTLTDQLWVTDLEPVALLTSETVCPECWLAYHAALPSCPNCELR